MNLTILHAVKIVLLVLFIYILNCSIQRDIENKEQLARDPYTAIDKKKTFADLPLNERLKIESVVDDYFTKRKMNKSHCSKIKKAIFDGVVRGSVGGLIINATIGNIINGATTFGVVNGLMKMYTLHHSPNSFIIQDSFT